MDGAEEVCMVVAPWEREALIHAAGREARQAGLREAANPYPACTREHELWWKGWAGENPEEPRATVGN